MKPTSAFGSDVYEDYTAVYTWQSNQMAHAMMGFAGTTLLAHAIVTLGANPWWALAFAVIPALKDLTDYAVDLTRTGPIFPTTDAHRAEMRADGLTDNLFWIIGTLLAAFLAVSAGGKGPAFYALALVAAAVTVGGILGPGRRWTARKLGFDEAGLPFFFRLPNFTGNPVRATELPADDGAAAAEGGRADAVRAVEAVTYGHDGAADHLIVSGPPRCRKTTLAAGIGSGLTVRGVGVRYLSQAALIDVLSAPPPTDRARTEPVTPESVDTVIVDDLALPFPDPEMPGRLAGRQTVWVVADPAHAEEWRTRLRAALPGRMLAIELGRPRPEEQSENSAVPWPAAALSVVTLAVSAVAGVGSLLVVLFG
ncbi:MAG: hypothetical protein RID91_06785 [Azospirillaceae bacterium]